MTTFELEQEQEKAHKLAEVASRGAAIATQLGEDGERVRVFLNHYFRHVDPLDMDERSVEDLLGLVEAHYRDAMSRPSARAHIEIGMPSVATDGWSAGGATVVQIVTDDRPFLVDSVTMEVLRQGWSIREVFHPQFLVRRDLGGTLNGIVTATEAKGDPAVLPESWMHLEILPPARTDVDDGLVPAFEQGLLEVLRLVEEAVQDWSKMITRADETVTIVERARQRPGPGGRAVQGVEFLRWLIDHHFTFLGYREYRWSGAGDAASYEPVPATGLGILRADRDASDAFHAWPKAEPARDHDHHEGQPQVAGAPAGVSGLPRLPAVRSGRLGGRRAPIPGSVLLVGILRVGASGAAVTAEGKRGAAPLGLRREQPRRQGDHGRAGELSARRAVPGAGASSWPPPPRRSPISRSAGRSGCSSGATRTSGICSCLVYLPRDRYTTAVRNKMQDILLERLGGETIDYTARVTESVLARLHFVVRMAVGACTARLRRPDARARADRGHPHLERRVRRSGRRRHADHSRRTYGLRRAAGRPGRRAARGLQGGLHPEAGAGGLRGPERRASAQWRWRCSSRTDPRTSPICG